MNSYLKKQISFAAFTFVIYTLLVGWQAAIMLLVGVGFHEYSHLLAAKRMGLPTKGFFLLPFVGGVALVSGEYKTFGQQAFVVLAGPVGGGLLALVTAGVYYLTGIPAFAAAAAWMCWLNLFNLLPLSFMDGGQLLGTITYSINKTLGMVLHVLSTVIAVVVLWFYNPILSGLVLLFGGGGVIIELRNWHHFRTERSYLCDERYLHPPAALSVGQIALTVAGWAGTAGILLLASYLLQQDPSSAISTIIHR
jgi:putative peptide zinc metalloprotease protein